MGLGNDILPTKIVIFFYQMCYFIPGGFRNTIVFNLHVWKIYGIKILFLTYVPNSCFIKLV